MKNILYSILFFFSMLFIVPTMSGECGSVKAQSQVKITGNGVRLRTAPSLDAEIYHEVNKGKVLRCFGLSANRDWYEVLYDGLHLYVSRDYATPVGGNSSSHSGNRAQYCVVNAHNLRLRTGPSTTYPYLVWTATGNTVFLNHGDVLNFTGNIQNGFCQVYFDNKYVWVARKYVKLK